MADNTGGKPDRSNPRGGSGRPDGRRSAGGRGGYGKGRSDSRSAGAGRRDDKRGGFRGKRDGDRPRDDDRRGAGRGGRDGDRKEFRSSRGSNDRKGYQGKRDDRRSSSDRKDFRGSRDGERGSFRGKADGDRRDFHGKRDDDRRRSDDRRGAGRDRDKRSFDDRKGFRDRRDERREERSDKGDRKEFRGKRDGDRRNFDGKRPGGRKPFDKKGPKRPSDRPRPAEDASEETQEQPAKKGWTPKVERVVKSKKEYDRERVERVMEGPTTVYRGELDPRKKDEEEKARKAKAAEEKAAESAENPYGRNDAASDFRDRFERCEASPARLAALYVTREVRRREAFAQQLIDSEIETSNMSAVDRAFATLLVLGVVSTQGTLDDIINRALSNPRDIKPDVRDPLRISTYEIILLGKAPHAALDQGVELVKAVVPSASRLANAVLHRILAMKDDFPFGDPTHDLGALARSFAFPEWMAQKLVDDMGAKEASTLMRASNDPAPLFIAVNSLLASDVEVDAAFADAGVELVPGEAGGITPPGCYRVTNPRILADGRIRRFLSQGKILVSDAAAQAVAASVLDDGEPASLLEVGAGRGTKTILLQSNANRLFGHQMDMTSLDSHSFKTDLLAKRAQEYGVELTGIVTGNATRLYRALDDKTFDAVFIDAPCSGLGTLRRHHEIRWRLKPEQISDLADTGLAMLKSAAAHVAPGGQIVYSTCTVTYDENNGVVKRFLESPEGADFELAPIAGKACFVSQLGPDSCDAHFAVRFRRRA